MTRVRSHAVLTDAEDEARAKRRVLSAIRLVGLGDTACILANLCQSLGEQAEKAGEFTDRELWWRAADTLELAALEFPEELTDINKPLDIYGH